MKYAIVENGMVLNMAESSRPLESSWVLTPIGSLVSIGDSYDGQLFFAPDGSVRMTPEQAYMQQRIMALEEELAAAKQMLGMKEETDG